MSVSRFELALTIVAFLCLGILLAVYAGGPQFSDELWYMHVGLNNVEDPFILNRYTHVYLQKLFMELASTPLMGVKAFWSFVVTLTGFLIYWNARLLTPRSHPLHGGIAALIFFSLKFISEYCGVTVVDLTAMLMLTLVVTFYLSAARVNFSRPWQLVALGFAIFLAFKAKETTLACLVLLAGLGYAAPIPIEATSGENGTAASSPAFRMSALGKNTLRVLLGLVGGALFFAILNGLILGNPLFGLTPGSLGAFLGSYVAPSLDAYTITTTDWYTGLVASLWLFPFLLYVISGLKATQDEHTSPSVRLVWLVPLVMVCLLTLLMLRSYFEAAPRFFFPALPVICMLAPQFLDFRMPYGRHARLNFWLTSAGGAVLLASLALATRLYARQTGWDYVTFLRVAIYPVILSVLLGVFVLARQPRPILPILGILALTLYPLVTNIKYIFILRENDRASDYRFYPFAAFEEEIEYFQDARILVSTNVTEDLRMLSTDENELYSMFNVFFEANAGDDTFTYLASPYELAENLSQTDFSYVLLTERDWQIANSEPASLALITANYQVSYEAENESSAQHGLVLLIRQ